MKRVWILLCLLFLLCACGRADVPTGAVVSAPPTIAQTQSLPENRTVRVGVTEMLADSPVMEQLRTQFEAQSDYRLEYVINPNNVAISVAQSGGADLLLVLQDTPTRQFIASGGGVFCDDWLQASLVLAGPASDPADVRSAQTAAQAFRRIADAGATFVSRYDDSDVCRAESALWSRAGIVIGNGRKWYKAARLEMVGTLRMASEKGAYVLCEKETFLQNRGETALSILLDGTPDLTQSYCIVPVSPDQSDRVNADGASAFAAFLQRAETLAFLTSYGTESYGCPIFDYTFLEE